MKDIRIFRNGKNVCCSIDGKDEPLLAFALYLGMEKKEKILEKFENEKPAFLIEDTSDEELVKLAEQLYVHLDKIFN